MKTIKGKLRDTLSEVKFAQDNYEDRIISGNEGLVAVWWEWAQMLEERGITTKAYMEVLRHPYMRTSVSTSQTYLSCARAAIKKYGTLAALAKAMDMEYLTMRQVKTHMTAVSGQRRAKSKPRGSVKREVASLVAKYGKAAVLAAVKAAR